MMMSIRNSHFCSEPHQGIHSYSDDGKLTDLDVGNTEEVVTSPDPTSPQGIPYTGTNIEINSVKPEVEVLWVPNLDKAEDKIPVKALRKLIPQGFKECYHQNDDDSTKKKLKHQWDVRPEDWPEDIPFVDPNNGIRTADKSSGKSPSSVHGKPGKEKLLQMYRFLKSKYAQCPRDKSGKSCSENLHKDRLAMNKTRVVSAINQVKSTLESRQFIGCFDNKLKQMYEIKEIIEILYEEARRGFEAKKQFYEVSHIIEKNMDLTIEDLNYLFSINCDQDLQKILDNYRAQGSVNMAVTEQQHLYDVSKITYEAPSHTITSPMCSLDNKISLPGNTYISVASEEDIKTPDTQSDLVVREGNGFPLKIENTPLIDLKGSKSVQVKSEEFASCKASRHPVTEHSMVHQQDSMPTMQPVLSISPPSQSLPAVLLADDDVIYNVVTQPELNPVATEHEVHVQTPSVCGHTTPTVQPTEQIVSSNSSLMDVSLVANSIENPVVNPATNGVQCYTQQYHSPGQQGNYPVYPLDQPPGQEIILNLLELLGPQPTQILDNIIGQTNGLAWENQPFDQQTTPTQSITDGQSPAIRDQQAGAGEYQQTEMSENGQPSSNAEYELKEQMMENVQSLHEDYGHPTTFLTHSNTNRREEVDCNLDSPVSEMAVDVSPLIPLTVQEMEEDEMEVDSPRAGSKRTSFSHDHNMASGGKKTRRY